MDVWGPRAAVSVPSTRSITRISLPAGRIVGESSPGAVGAPLRFRGDGNTLLIGDSVRRQIITVDWRTGAVLARLPVPVQPGHFCFNDNGGQMFVSGAGADAVVIVAPYQNEVYETIPAGRAPGAMTTSNVRNLLLVCNPSVGDLTILNVDTRSLAASVHVGDTPADVLVTPDGEYAMTVNSGSGSVAVIRLSTVLNRGQNELTARGIKPLFTMFPMITAPEGAAILPKA
jgi:DNA-binding beta-propeller fold protein YncE